MWFTHVEYVGTLEGFDPPMSLIAYAKMVVRVLVRSVIEEGWLAVLIVAVAAWWQMLQHRVPLTRREHTLLAATVLAIAAKFVVFPLHQDRFYAAYLVVFCLTLIGAMANVRFETLPVAGDKVSFLVNRHKDVRCSLVFGFIFKDHFLKSIEKRIRLFCRIRITKFRGAVSRE